MRTVLIVTPHFPPVNAADHQRVRMSLPYLRENGWEPTVLAVRPGCMEGMPLDPLLEQTVPREIEVNSVGAFSARLTRAVGLGNLAMRSLPFLWTKGCQLLGDGYRRGRPFDLVYFSTTQFPVMILGPIWKWRFGVPYVVDFQDPWVDDYYEKTSTPPPGGKSRYRASQVLASQLEPRVMRDVSQVIAVSPSYVHTLRDRYPYLSPNQFTVLPFGAPERDFELLPQLQLKQSVFNPADGSQHWLYVGAVGSIMEKALRLLFSALAKLRSEKSQEWLQLQLHFAGTSYAPSGRAVKTVEPIAVECGMGEVVEESTDRLPYFETLQALMEADALLIVGSDSSSYSASKIYPYILARKPILSILHEESPAVEILRRCRAGEVVTFDPENLITSATAMARALENLRKAVLSGEQPEINWSEFEQYTAREMTRRICKVFDEAVTASPSS